MNHHLNRRNLLSGCGGIAIASLAGCLGNDDDELTDEGDDTDQDGPGESTDGGAGTFPPDRHFDGWPMDGQNPANTNSITDQSGPTEPVESIWTFETELPIEHQVAVVDNTVVVVGGETFGRGVGFGVYGLDAHSGDQEWQFEGEADRVTAPVVLDDMVFVGTDSAGTVHAIDINTGEEEWSDSFALGINPPSITADSDRLYVTAGSPGDVELSAVDATTGERDWTVEVSQPSRGLAVANGTIYNGLHDLDAVEAATGNLRWSIELLSLEEETTPSPPAIGHELVYLARETLQAREVETGDLRWSFDPLEHGQFKGSPAVNADTIFVGTSNDKLHALDATEGDKQWEFEAESSIGDSPAIADGAVYVGSLDEHLYALDADTGERYWQFQLGSWVSASPAIVDGVVFAGTSDGTLYALAAE